MSITYESGKRPKEPKVEVSLQSLRNSSPIALASFLLANLYPCFAVLFFGWTVSDVMIVYWAESLIIILFTRLKMLYLERDWEHYAPDEGKLYQNGKLLPPRKIPHFFLFFYCFFSFGHGVFTFMFFAHGLNYTWAGFALALTMLAMSHGVSFMTNYIGEKEYEHTTLDALFRLPLKRLLLLHIVILGGGLIISYFPVLNMVAILLLFTGLKIAFDLRAHLRVHRSARTNES